MIMFNSESSSRATSDMREELLPASASLEPPKKPVMETDFFSLSPFWLERALMSGGCLLVNAATLRKKISLALLIPTVTQNTKYT